VHRDVTPDNVFVGFDGRVLLGDFGVTHVQAFGDSSPHHAVGKLGYFAPESMGTERIDRRADIFSAGVMLFELLTGTRLFEAEDDERTLAQMADARVPPLHRYVPEIDRELAAIVARALAKRPRDRFETAEDLAVELEPHWSKAIANPPALDALVAATFPTEARAWAVRHTPETLETVDLSWPTG
jgi:serine/threonine-protein kinase